MARPQIKFRRVDNDSLRGSRAGITTVADNPNRPPPPLVNPASSREALGSHWFAPDVKPARDAIDAAIPKIKARKAQNAALRKSR